KNENRPSPYAWYLFRSSPRPPYDLENGIAQACTVAPSDHQTYSSWQSFVTDRQNGTFNRNAIHFSSLNLKAATIDEIDSDIGWTSDAYAIDACLNDIYDLDAYGLNSENIPSATTNWDINSTSREYTDYTYSDTGSLFSGSDEASWSTDSYRGSTSTEGTF
ncbi:hypothetical protein KI387_037564, partial [Taxus chinensis]